MKGKKGLEQTLIALILLLVVAVIVFFAGVAFSRWAEKQGTVEGCRISVLAAAQLGKGTPAGILSGAPVEFECPPTTVVIEEDKALIDRFEKKFSDASYEENVKRVLADQLAQCWYKFGEGKVDAFQQFPLLDVSNYVCFYCSHIEFKNAPVTEITGLNMFLEKEKMSVGVVTQDGLTYYDYIMENYDEQNTRIRLAISDSIYPSGPYAAYDIIFQVRPTRVVGAIDLNEYALYLGASPEQCEYYYE